MDKTKIIETVDTSELKYKDFLDFLHGGEIIVFRRVCNKIWTKYYFRPCHEQYYLLCQYDCFDISWLERFNSKDEIFKNLMLYEDEYKRSSIVSLLKEDILSLDFILKIRNFKDGFYDFLNSGKTHATYVLY